MPPDPRALCMYPQVATPSSATALVSNSGPPIVFCFATPLFMIVKLTNLSILFLILFNAVQDCIKGQWVIDTHCQRNI